MNAPEPTETETPATAEAPRMRRSVLGIRRADAAEEMARLDAKIARLHEKVDEYDRMLVASKSTIGAQEDELRYLRGRQVRIDEQYRTANAEAARLVSRARRTSESLIGDAQGEAREIAAQAALTAQETEARRREIEVQAQRTAHAIAGGIAQVERALATLRESVIITTGGRSPDAALTLTAATTEGWHWPTGDEQHDDARHGAQVASAEGDIAITTLTTVAGETSAITNERAQVPITLIAAGVSEYATALELEQTIAALDGVRDVYLRALDDDAVELAIDSSLDTAMVADAIVGDSAAWMLTATDERTITVSATQSVEA